MAKPLRKIVGKSSKKDNLRSKTPWEFAHKQKVNVAKNDVPSKHEQNFKADIVGVYNREKDNYGHGPDGPAVDGSYGAAPGLGEETEQDGEQHLDEKDTVGSPMWALKKYRASKKADTKKDTPLSPMWAVKKYRASKNNEEAQPEHEGEQLDEAAKKRFNVTYDKVTPQSAEQGDFSDHGYVNKHGDMKSAKGRIGKRGAQQKKHNAMRLRDAIGKIGHSERRSDTSRYETDGEHEGDTEIRKAIHFPRNTTTSSLRRLHRLVKKERGGFGEDTEPEGEQLDELSGKSMKSAEVKTPFKTYSDGNTHDTMKKFKSKPKGSKKSRTMRWKESTETEGEQIDKPEQQEEPVQEIFTSGFVGKKIRNALSDYRRKKIDSVKEKSSCKKG